MLHVFLMWSNHLMMLLLVLERYTGCNSFQYRFQFDFTVSATVDVWGCEQDMFVPCLTPVTTTTLKTTCTSQHCPQQIQECNRSSIQILDGNVEKSEDKLYLESLFYHWLCPPPKPCDMQFQQQPPPTAPTKVGRPQLALADDTWLNLCVVEVLACRKLDILSMDFLGFYQFSLETWHKLTSLMGLTKFQSDFRFQMQHTNWVESHSGIKFIILGDYSIVAGGMIMMVYIAFLSRK